MENSGNINVLEERPRLTRELAEKQLADFTKQLKVAHKRFLTETEQKYCEGLLKLFLKYHSSKDIYNTDIQRVEERWPSASEISMEQLVPKTPENLQEFWHYFAYGLQKNQIDLPDFLVPVTDFSFLGQSIEELGKESEINQWRSSFQDKLSTKIESLSIRELSLRLVITRNTAIPEWRFGKSDFQPFEHEQFEQFKSDFEKKHLKLHPEATSLWLAMLTYFKKEWNPRFDLTLPEAQRLVYPLLLNPQAETQVVNAKRAPFRRQKELLRWAFQADPENETHYQLTLTTHEGKEIEEHLLFLPGSIGLFIGWETIYYGELSFDTFYDGPISIPKASIETSEGINLLLNSNCTLPSSLIEQIDTVSLQTRIVCRLENYPTPSSSECLVMEVDAGAAGAWQRQIFTQQGWKPKKKTTAKDNRFIHYDQSALKDFDLNPELLNLQFEESESCWYTRITKAFADQFENWQRNLSPSIILKAEGELQTLLRAPVRAKVKIQCDAATSQDWFDIRVVLTADDTQLTKEELNLLLKAKGSWVRIQDKGWRRLQFDLSKEEYEEISKLGLDPEDFSEENHQLHVLQLAEATEKVLSKQQLQKIRKRIKTLKTEIQPQVPENVKATLRPYQVNGFHFLAYLTLNQFGGILADDMGLGKTLQTLVWLNWLQSHTQSKTPCLIVCPKSVVDTWITEVERFIPDLHVVKYDRSIPVTKSIPKKADLVVMNYAQMRARVNTLIKTEWLALILDEGQNIKNPRSQSNQIACDINAQYRLVLTGTPIENRALDLWSLMQFAMPGVMGNQASFTRRFEKQDDPYVRQRLSARVRPFLLRRTKQQVIPDLPDRIEEDIFCEFEPEQEKLYKAELKRARQQLLKIKTSDSLAKNKFNILQSLLKLRQICCHPALTDQVHKQMDSAKIKALLEMLEELREEGHKVLVFSQFVKLLDLVRGELDQQNSSYHYLTGKTENRNEVIKAFQDDPQASPFLLSLKAAGSGLNLTSASYVILFDPWWNPAVENQAIDRTHRIGQTNNVIAYRFLIKNSVEEKIKKLQQRKQQLTEDVLNDESYTKALTMEDFEFLFEETS